MSVSVLRKEEKEEGGRKILAVFLPSFTSILLSPCGSRLLRARRAKGAMDSGQDADSLCCCGLPRPPRKGSRSPPARSGRQSQTRLSFWPNCSFQHSKEPRGRRNHDDGGENVVAATCIFNDVIFHASWT